MLGLVSSTGGGARVAPCLAVFSLVCLANCSCLGRRLGFPSFRLRTPHSKGQPSQGSPLLSIQVTIYRVMFTVLKTIILYISSCSLSRRYIWFTVTSRPKVEGKPKSRFALLLWYRKYTDLSESCRRAGVHKAPGPISSSPQILMCTWVAYIFSPYYL